MPIYAGGILTNTNQHAAFLRMLARGASIGIDGVYSNPAGLSFLPHDGLYLSLTNQSTYQVGDGQSGRLFNPVVCLYFFRVLRPLKRTG